MNKRITPKRHHGIAVLLAFAGIAMVSASMSCAVDDEQPTSESEYNGEFGLLDEEEDIFDTIEDIEPTSADDSIGDPPDDSWAADSQKFQWDGWGIMPLYDCPKCTHPNCKSATSILRSEFGKRKIRPGSLLYGGSGDVRGQITEAGVYLNCGIRKKLHIAGSPQALYAWYVAVNGGIESGWIREDALEEPFLMPTRNNPKRAYNRHVHRFANASVAAGLAKKYAGIRVADHGGPDGNLITHYLPTLDPDKLNYVVNVSQSIPGHNNGHGLSNDTYSIDEAEKITGTKPHANSVAKDERTSFPVALYGADGKPYMGCKNPPCRMTFLYVKIRGRYGWIAKVALARKVVGTIASADPDAGSSDAGSSTCGAEGAACCDGTGCGDGLTCSNATCVLCGDIGEPCCGGACESGVCVNGTCQSCGDVGQPCCDSGACFAGTCIGGSCQSCGAAWEPCCSGFCDTDRLVCNGSATCQPCGDHGAICCPTGPACNDPSNKCTNGACASVCYARCMNGTLQGIYNAASAADCLSWSDAACASAGGKGRVELNMVNIFDNHICGALGQLCCMPGDTCAAGKSCTSGPAPYQKTCK